MSNINSFENGFDPLDDIFYRKPLYDLIMRFVHGKADDGLVLALDDRWGNGKTTFIKMLVSEINKNESADVNVIYYDAFENDCHSEPFLSLTSEIYQSIDNKKSKMEKIKAAIVDSGKKVGVNLLKSGASYAVTTLSAGLLNGSVLEGVKDKVSSSLSDPLEKYIEERIQSGRKDKEDITVFKDALKSIYDNGGKKTIFIIDELDRARPDFALELLEKVKHIFSVRGFVFLLSLNREQFEKSIEKRYGNIDSSLYLNKFVDYWFSLPKMSSLDKIGGIHHARSTMVTQIRELDKGVNILSRNGRMEGVLVHLLEVYGCSLREAEKCCKLIHAIENREGINNFSRETDLALLSLVVFLKVTNPTLLDDIRRRVIDKQEVFKGLGILNASSDDILTLQHVLNYHYATEDELLEARKSRLFADIESFIHPGARRDVFAAVAGIIQFLKINK